MIGSLVANGLALYSLLVLDASVWTAIAIFWVETLIHLPFLARAVGRAIPGLSDAELEAFIARREVEVLNGVSIGRRIRLALEVGGRDAAARAASRGIVTFWIGFPLVAGLFLFVLAVASGGPSQAVPMAGGTLFLYDLSMFDARAIALAGAGVLVAEVVEASRGGRAMPDLALQIRRSITLLLLAFVAGLLLSGGGAATRGLAVGFVGLKTLADVHVGRTRGDAGRG